MSKNIAKELQDRFTKSTYENFGEALKEIEIHGFRGMRTLKIKFGFPITAISGFNGTGKSTICQLALCGYSMPSRIIDSIRDSVSRRKYVADFFPITPIDRPFTDDAEIIYNYANEKNHSQRLTVARTVSGNWSGYKRQPNRLCFYFGISFFIPLNEKTLLDKKGEKTIKTQLIDSLSDTSLNKVRQILQAPYEEAYIQGVLRQDTDKQSALAVFKRHGYEYSENHMGFGEARLLKMINILENAPEKSLVILEEPEISLHEFAQRRFAEYLLDVCKRKGHQIILSTHSSAILEGLPSIACKFLVRDIRGVTVFDGLSSNEARALLSGGSNKALSICVEDTFAKDLLTHIILKYEQLLLKSITIEAVGDKDVISNIVPYMNKFSYNAIGVRDPDVGENKANRLYSLPGTNAPEREVYMNEAVKAMLQTKYNIDANAVLLANDKQDHHQFELTFAHTIGQIELASTIRVDSIRTYIEDKGYSYFTPLLQNIKAAVDKRKTVPTA